MSRPQIAARHRQPTICEQLGERPKRPSGVLGAYGGDPGEPHLADSLNSADEHTHGDDDGVRFIVRGSGVFYLHAAGRVHAVQTVAGDLIRVPPHTTHWFDMGLVPDFTTIRFFRNKEGWVAFPTGSDISRRFPDADAVRARARAIGPA
jgi:cupin superfamily acireductone dioxygenase involved in methionine salvage